ncbi:MAG: GAP family protein [Acidimicrobiia bacterium]|nr:GAP family protein [Acidimicrobiia bacterium]
MGSAIGQILAPAIGVAISPVPIIAVILMLFSNHATRNSVSFAIGWLAGLTAAGFIVLSLDVETSDGDPSDTSGWIKVVLGVLLLGLGVRNWRSRPRDGEEPETPGWMEAIDEFSAVKSLGLGVLLSAVNPKNLALTISAAVTITNSDLSSGDQAVVMIVFVLIASVTIILPVLVNLIMGEKADAGLTSMKEWLNTNNATVMSVLFLVFGAKVLGDGLAILL